MKKHHDKPLYTKDDVIDILDELYMTIQEMENPLNYDFDGHCDIKTAAQNAKDYVISMEFKVESETKNDLQQYSSNDKKNEE